MNSPESPKELSLNPPKGVTDKKGVITTAAVLIALLNALRLSLLMFRKLTVVRQRLNIRSHGRTQDYVCLTHQRKEAVFLQIAQSTALQVHAVLRGNMLSKHLPQQESLVVLFQAIAICYDLFLIAPGVTLRALSCAVSMVLCDIWQCLRLPLLRGVLQTITRYYR